MLLQDDLGGYPVYRAADAEFADQLRLAQEMENDLAEAGIRDAKSASCRPKAFRWRQARAAQAVVRRILSARKSKKSEQS
jgi:hypothetical protein